MQKIKTIYPRVLGRPSAQIPVLLMLPFALIVFAGFLGNLMLAYAEGEVPGLGQSVMGLFMAIKDKATAAVIAVAVIQVLKTNEAIGLLGKLGLSGNGLRVATALIVTLGYVAEAWVRSGNLGAAAIEGLFTSGGAMLIFSAFKKEVVTTVEDKAPAAVAAVSVAAVPRKRGSTA